LESGDTASMVEMRVRIYYQPDVFHSEAKLRDTGGNDRCRLRQGAIQKD
jgi:hypothetical protein